MNKDLTLVILAAGMGSRFGGLKQIEPVGPNGEFIIDYSIYDALKAGFNKVVFIIKKSFEKEFKETIGKRIEGKIKVEYAYQEELLGTGHAVMQATSFMENKKSRMRFSIASVERYSQSYSNCTFSSSPSSICS